MHDHKDINEPAYFRHMFKVGTVSKISKDSAGRPYARIQYQDRQGVTTAPFPILQKNTIGTADFSCPRVGEQVCVAHFGTGFEQGVILGSVYTDKVTSPVSDGTLNKRHVTFDDGSLIEFDPSSGKFNMDINGDADIKTASNLNATVSGDLTASVTGNANVTAAQVNINGPTKIVGNVQIQGNITHTGDMVTSGVHTGSNGVHV